MADEVHREDPRGVDPEGPDRRGDAPRQLTPVEPNDLWTVDFKGWWRTLDGTRCDPLTVRDAVSRYVLAMRAMRRTRTEDVRPVFEELFDRYGLPKAIHSANSPPFASLRGPGGLTQLSAWWGSLGIQVVLARPRAFALYAPFADAPSRAMAAHGPRAPELASRRPTSTPRDAARAVTARIFVEPSAARRMLFTKLAATPPTRELP